MIKTPIAALLLATSLAFCALLSPSLAIAQVELTVMIAPPPLPVYEQPPIPGPGYLWVPGYWSYGPYGYFWVPGTWVQPPSVGLLWTPGYWGFVGGVYAFNAGYWGPHIGFYGGINYGFGYGGVGYQGGYWNNGNFFYNRSVNNISNTNISNVYNRTVVTNNNTTINNVSYNGGTGGTAARATPQELAAARETHTPATAAQTQHVQTAAANPELRASANQGHPTIAATSRPGQFSGAGVVPAKTTATATPPAAAA